MGIGGNMSINCIAVDLQSLPIVAFMDRSITHHTEQDQTAATGILSGCAAQNKSPHDVTDALNAPTLKSVDVKYAQENNAIDQL